MIIRVQFVECGTRKIIHSWCLFSVNETKPLREILDKIYDKELSCGRELNLNEYEKEEIYASSITSTQKCPTDLMPAPLLLTVSDIKESNGSLYIQYELKHLEYLDVSRIAASTSGKLDEVEPTDTITNALMNRCNHYLSPKPSAKTQDTKQYNALVNLVKEQKFGVRGSLLAGFEELLALFSSLLWEIDPHNDKVCNHGGGRFPMNIERLLGFNDPKKHKHPVKSINIESLKAKVIHLIIKLEQKYMMQQQIRPFREIVSTYSSYLENQRSRVQENNQRKEEEEVSSISDFSVAKLKQVSVKPYFPQLEKITHLLAKANVYMPINVNENFNVRCPQLFFKLKKKVVDEGFPVMGKNLFYFRLPSQGPHPAIHFIWKADTNDVNIQRENTKLVVTLIMVSADTKCKISVGEPGFPIAAVTRGKLVVGKNETFKVGDHDYSEVSLIPDAMLFHSIPENADL